MLGSSEPSAPPGRHLHLASTDRLLIVLPHPDDESLATAGLIQMALGAGSAIQLLLATDGDNNPWAQRVSERTLRITSRERARFGAIRRGEALAALTTLGVPREAVTFLALPDQGLTELFVRADERLFGLLRDAVRRFQPTVIVSPSSFDRHPDHSALGAVVTQVLSEPADRSPRDLRFLVHAPDPIPSGTTAVRLEAAWLARKRTAIACHGTQRFWRGSWLEGFVRAEEPFHEGEPEILADRHPVRSLARNGRECYLAFAPHPRLRRLEPRTLLLAGRDSDHRAVRMRLPLWPRFGSVAITDPRDGAHLGSARMIGQGRGHGRALSFPGHLLPPDAELFAKIEHTLGFFDVAGWRRIEARKGAR